MNTLTPEINAPLKYDDAIEDAIKAIETRLSDGYYLSSRAAALLLLQDDEEMEEIARSIEGDGYAIIDSLIQKAKKEYPGALDSAIVLQRRNHILEISRSVMQHAEHPRKLLSEKLSRICMSPITGLPVLALVLWFGLYQFVGVFGGGTLVNLFEKDLFGQHVNPWVSAQVIHFIPWKWLSDLFVGEYGMWTLGVTYAVALIFPIVGTFFIAFSILEDSGYFPRLAMLIDRLFKGIGLNGKAVIPIVLGFGCDTMATIVTRILETPRERIIATFLLSLAIPCSAQMGVMTAMLTGHPEAFVLWIAIMSAIFLLIGYLTAKLMPGEAARFTIELPPLRWPSPSNILIKTYSRIQWYFMEVFPLFLLASFVIWLGKLTHVFQFLVECLVPVVRLLGLPDKAAEAFLFGFFRRDYGAAGLYKLQEHGALGGRQLLVSVVTLTIFLPCIAQFLMVKKERGLKMALAMAGFIFPFAIAVGASLNLILKVIHVHL
jgi:ferrous iron transport protein B